MANGNFGGGDGSSTAPYLIEDSLDLKAVDSLGSSHFKLANNIDISGIEWIPLCRSTNFSGVFDGNGYSINGLTIKNFTDYAYCGLFALVRYGGIVKNVKMNDAYIYVYGKDRVGLLIGQLSDGGYAINCHVQGRIDYDGDCNYVGGLVGIWHHVSDNQYYDNAGIQDCTTTIELIGSGYEGNNIGGLIGYASAYRYDYINYYCAIRCSVLEGSKVHGSSSSYYIGGFVGYLSNYAIICDSYSLANHNGYYYSGGFVGYAYYGGAYRCFSAGYTNGDYGFGGYVRYGNWADNYWDTEASGTTSNYAGATGITTLQAKTSTTYPASWHDQLLSDGVTKAWKFHAKEGITYPLMHYQSLKRALMYRDGEYISLDTNGVLNSLGSSIPSLDTWLGNGLSPLNLGELFTYKKGVTLTEKRVVTTSTTNGKIDSVTMDLVNKFYNIKNLTLNYTLSTSYVYRVLLKSDNKIKKFENGIWVDLPHTSVVEQDFIDYGADPNSNTIDPISAVRQKGFILDHARETKHGKVFEHELDLSALGVSKIEDI